MNRTHLGVLCLTALLILAGCTALPNSNSTTTTTEPSTTPSPTTTPHTSTTPPATTTTLTTTSTPTPTTTNPFGTNLTHTHNTTVRTASGLRAHTTINLSSTDDSGTTGYTTQKTFAVNFTTDRARMHRTGGTTNSTSDVYTNATARYKRTINSPYAPDKTLYEKTTPPYSRFPDIQPVTTHAVGTRFLRGITPSAYTKTGTTTWQSHTVTIYRGTGAAALPTTVSTFINTENATVTLYVDATGIVRHIHIQATTTTDGTTTHYELTHNITHVGPTPVAPPTWLSAAENATSH